MAVKLKNISHTTRILRTPKVVFGDVWYEPGGQCGPRIQPDYELVIVLSGDARVQVEGETSFITPSSVALMQPGRHEEFQFSRKGRTRHTWCAVHPSLVSRTLAGKLRKLPQVLPQSRTFDLLMEAAFSVADCRSAEARALLTSLGLTLLEEYARMNAAESENPQCDTPWEKARLFIEAHVDDTDCLAGAARAAGLSPQHLTRLFRRHYRITPDRLIWQTRIEHGAALLAETGLSITEIAYRVGCKNPFHFSRLIKRSQGLSPRELRRKAWGRRKDLR